MKVWVVQVERRGGVGNVWVYCTSLDDVCAHVAALICDDESRAVFENSTLSIVETELV